MTKSQTYNHTFKDEKRSKVYYILQLKRNNPEMRASEIAARIQTTPSYVYNVLSKNRKRGEVERGREDRLYAVAHGHYFYRDKVWSEWCKELVAPIVNPRTGMKQVGFKEYGDPCSCQIHKGGGVMVFPHALGWREWLQKALMKCGWDLGRASLLVNNLTIQVVLAEAGVKVLDGFLPKDLFLKTAWGMAVIRDDSPTKNMLEVKLSVPDLSRYLGLPEMQTKLDLLTKGSLTMNQLLRGLIALLLQKLGAQQ
jgi:hypothetical protein